MCLRHYCDEMRTNSHISHIFLGFSSVSLGADYTLMLKQDGTVWATGANTFGQLGIDIITRDVVTNFVRVWPGEAKAVAAGGSHSMVLKKDGSVWCTGGNAYGQFGDGSTINSDKFGSVIHGYAKGVAAGAQHSFVVMKDGSVWATGCNARGQLGDGSTVDRSEFVEVIADSAETVSAGDEHSMVLMQDGSVRVSGDNEYGQLGDESTDFQDSFLEVLTSGVTAVSAGSQHSMVLKQDGSVWVTGDNAYGQLGDGLARSRHSFAQVISSGGKAIAAGYDHSIVLKQDGSVWVTGRNNYGQLGIGAMATSFTSTFRQVISTGTKAVAAGDYHSMVLKDDGSLWGTGANLYGQLGDGSKISKNTYTRVSQSGNAMWENSKDSSGRFQLAAIACKHALID